MGALPLLLGALLASSPPALASGCGETCALEDHHGPPALTRADYLELLGTWSHEPLGDPTEALETLLYHWDGTLMWMGELGTPGLNPQQAAFLQDELARQTYDMEMRLVEDGGQIRATLAAADLPLDHKEHLTFDLDGSGLQPFLTSGRSKRVGLGHLWSRW